MCFSRFFVSPVERSTGEMDDELCRLGTRLETKHRCRRLLNGLQLACKTNKLTSAAYTQIVLSVVYTHLHFWSPNVDDRKTSHDVRAYPCAVHTHARSINNVHLDIEEEREKSKGATKTETGNVYCADIFGKRMTNEEWPAWKRRNGGTTDANRA